MFLQQILSCYNLKTSFAKLVKVLVLELFCGTRTRVHFSISVLVLEVFCGTRTRKLSPGLHHCPVLSLLTEFAGTRMIFGDGHGSEAEPESG